MSARRLRLDDLVGRVVYDTDGRAVGRIFEMRAEQSGRELVVVEYHLGPAAMLERVGLSLRRLAGLGAGHPTIVSWDALDLSDPERPLWTSADPR